MEAVRSTHHVLILVKAATAPVTLTSDHFSVRSVVLVSRRSDVGYIYDVSAVSIL